MGKGVIKKMSNGFTPRVFAHVIGLKAIAAAYRNENNEFGTLAPKEVFHTMVQLGKLYDQLAKRAKVDVDPLFVSKGK